MCVEEVRGELARNLIRRRFEYERHRVLHAWTKSVPCEAIRRGFYPLKIGSTSQISMLEQIMTIIFLSSQLTDLTRFNIYSYNWNLSVSRHFIFHSLGNYGRSSRAAAWKWAKLSKWIYLTRYICIRLRRGFNHIIRNAWYKRIILSQLHM